VRGTYPNRMACWCCGTRVRLQISGLLFYSQLFFRPVRRRVCAACWREIIGGMRAKRAVSW
jgi:hypothetical protein